MGLGPSPRTSEPHFQRGPSRVLGRSATALFQELPEVGLLGHLVPDRPIGNRPLGLFDKLPERRVLGRTGRQLGEVRLGKLGVRTVRDGHTAMLRRPTYTPVDGPGVRDPCANGSEFGETRRQPPDAKVLVDGHFVGSSQVAKSALADFPS